MKRVRTGLALLAAGAFGVLAAGAADAGAPAGIAPVLVPIAHSALVTVDATTEADTLILRVQRTSDQAMLPGAQLHVTLAGHPLAVTPRPDGTWQAALGSFASSPDRALEITVAHDGLREVLTGTLGGVARTPASGRSATVTGGGLLKLHKQLAWWILNIVVVLIGVIAVSRRMS
jgi:hypothetical protein